MIGYLYQPLKEKEILYDRKCYKIDDRHLYKVATLDQIYININEVPEIKSRGVKIEPINIHPAGFFMLREHRTDVTFSGVVYKTKLIYKITKFETIKETAYVFRDMPFFEFKFELYEAKCINEPTNSDKPFLFKVEGNTLSLFAECYLEGNILNSIGQPLIMKTLG